MKKQLFQDIIINKIRYNAVAAMMSLVHAYHLHTNRRSKTYAHRFMLLSLYWAIFQKLERIIYVSYDVNRRIPPGTDPGCGDRKG